MRGFKLLEHIESDANILQAYRAIKNKEGSKTAGVDGQTIKDIKSLTEKQVIQTIRERLVDYKPEAIRRIEIEKEDGRMRSLGIPTIWDRIIGQMFKQIIEPIAEAKFHKHNYGFRPNRGTNHALGRCNHLINLVGLHYVVDIDIKGFFDNINHTRLMKQLHGIGIADTRVLAIIKKMLKSPIKGIGTPTRGTVQGGVLSPLLANIALNEFDWWISNQWETFQGRPENKDKLWVRRMIKEKSTLKEMYIVRYCDDFKIFTRTWEQAQRAYQAVKEYLWKRLKLEISEEKSKITKLRKERSTFLGFEIKAVKKRNKYVAHTYISEKNKKKIKKELKEQIKVIQKHPTETTVNRYNQMVMGIQNYFQYATHVSVDLAEIGYTLIRTLHNRIRQVGKYGLPDKPSELYKQRYKNRYKTYEVRKIHLFPIADIRTKWAVQLKPQINNYTKAGRETIHENLSPIIQKELNRLRNTHVRCVKGNTIEYLDNKISRYAMQNGKCSITKEFLTAEVLDCHHITPKHLGGDDQFKNLVIISRPIHKLIHSENKEVIEVYLKVLNLTKTQLKKINQLREKCRLEVIV